jgi:hypothetical protein
MYINIDDKYNKRSISSVNNKMRMKGTNVYNKVINYIISIIITIIIVAIITLCIIRQQLYISYLHDININNDNQITIRVNTFRRNDLLRTFLDNYSKCSVVNQIQVIWSDPTNNDKIPKDWLSLYSNNKVIFEVHDSNSLNNRFKPLIDINTNAVLSLDDDIIIPCNVIEKSLNVWKANSNVLVGYSPRMVAYDIWSGVTRYLRWQHTWWNGFYSIILTKACLLHKKYLYEYHKNIPKEMLTFIDEHKNCEDIAFAHMIATLTNSPPVWINGVVYDIASNGISSGQSHFIDRGSCLSKLKVFTKQWPWVTGYQKSISMDWKVDWMKLWTSK